MQTDERDMLIRMDTNLNNLVADIAEIKAGKAPFCAVHEERLDKMESKQNWFRNTFVGAAGLLIVKYTVGFFIK